MNSLRALALGTIWATAGATFVPPNVHLSPTDASITIDTNGRVISTAELCPGFAFVQFGAAGPKLSPDQHWVLVDVLGPFAPGNVQRTHALVAVLSGRIVTGPDFPGYVGVPNSRDPVMWASGRRAALRYADGSTATVHDPPLRPLPERRCAPPQ